MFVCVCVFVCCVCVQLLMAALGKDRAAAVRAPAFLAARNIAACNKTKREMVSVWRMLGGQINHQFNGRR